jgi:hypothetical protein
MAVQRMSMQALARKIGRDYWVMGRGVDSSTQWGEASDDDKVRAVLAGRKPAALLSHAFEKEEAAAMVEHLREAGWPSLGAYTEKAGPYWWWHVAFGEWESLAAFDLAQTWRRENYPAAMALTGLALGYPPDKVAAHLIYLADHPGTKKLMKEVP